MSALRRAYTFRQKSRPCSREVCSGVVSSGQPAATDPCISRMVFIHAATEHVFFADAPDSNQLPPTWRTTINLSINNPQAMLKMLEMLGDNINACPTFAELLRKANDKQAFVKNIKPHVYDNQRTESGIRSSFCRSKAGFPSSLCPSCHQLQLLLSC